MEKNVEKWWNLSSLTPFHPCSSICISGPSGSGKTFFVYQFLRHIGGMFSDTPPKRVLYCYGVWQSKFEEVERELEIVSFPEGLPSSSAIDELSAHSPNNVIVLDDLLEQVLKSQEMEMLIIRGCHHKRLSVIFISQNIFSQNKYARTISLNMHYLVLFRNFRDSSQIAILGRQIFPVKPKMLLEAYNDSTMGGKYGYLVVDLSPHSEDLYRLRTKIMPGEDPIIYIPRT